MLNVNFSSIDVSVGILKLASCASIVEVSDGCHRRFALFLVARMNYKLLRAHIGGHDEMLGVVSDRVLLRDELVAEKSVLLKRIYAFVNMICSSISAVVAWKSSAETT